MKRNMSIGLAAVAALALVSWSWVVPAWGDEGDKEHHPEMRKAFHHLQQVKHELEAAKHNYGGHREKALTDAQKAMDEVLAALEGEGWKGPHHLAPGDDEPAPGEYKHHGEMHRALHHLQQAKRELEHSSRHYHGHRAEAVKHVERAIKHVKEGLASVE